MAQGPYWTERRRKASRLRPLRGLCPHCPVGAAGPSKLALRQAFEQTVRGPEQVLSERLGGAVTLLQALSAVGWAPEAVGTAGTERRQEGWPSPRTEGVVLLGPPGPGGNPPGRWVMVADLT